MWLTKSGPGSGGSLPLQTGHGTPGPLQSPCGHDWPVCSSHSHLARHITDRPFPRPRRWIVPQTMTDQGHLASAARVGPLGTRPSRGTLLGGAVVLACAESATMRISICAVTWHGRWTKQYDVLLCTCFVP